MSEDHRRFMREAIRLAEQGMQAGDGGPFGAVVVRDGEIVGRGWNRVLATNDPTAHAEVNAIRDACRRLGRYWLEGCELFVNCQPCPMCGGAIRWAHIAKVYYAATTADAAAIGFDDEAIARDICRPADTQQLPTEQLLREETLAVFRAWEDLPQRKDY